MREETRHGASGHVPVLLEQVLAWMDPRPGGTYVDATVGAGGHAEAILERVGSTGRLFGIDCDGEAIEIARARLAGYGSAVTLWQANYSAVRTLLADAGIEAVDGILMDLGVSSLQLQVPDRGFSFSRPGPLDMRMDRTQPLTAADLINGLKEEELSRVIWEYGEERWARRIARAVVRSRPLHTTDRLAEVVAGAIPRRYWPRGIHPSTRTFQAVRIATNRELESLKKALPDAVGALRGGGRLCVITFHSLEDRIVKHTYLRLSRGCTCPPGSPTCTCNTRPTVTVLTRRPVTPSAEEVHENPRARSAKLRVAERVRPKECASEAGQPSAEPTLPDISANILSPAPGFRRHHSRPTHRRIEP